MLEVSPTGITRVMIDCSIVGSSLLGQIVEYITLLPEGLYVYSLSCCLLMGVYTKKSERGRRPARRILEQIPSKFQLNS